MQEGSIAPKRNRIGNQRKNPPTLDVRVHERQLMRADGYLNTLHTCLVLGQSIVRGCLPGIRLHFG